MSYKFVLQALPSGLLAAVPVDSWRWQHATVRQMGLHTHRCILELTWMCFAEQRDSPADGTDRPAAATEVCFLSSPTAETPSITKTSLFCCQFMLPVLGCCWVPPHMFRHCHSGIFFFNLTASKHLSNFLQNVYGMLSAKCAGLACSMAPHTSAPMGLHVTCSNSPGATSNSCS